MKNGRNTTISDSFSYGIVMVIANIAGTIGLFIFMMILRALCGDSVVFSVQVHGWLLCSLLDLIISAVAMVVTALVTRFYFSYKIPDILPRNNDNALEQQNIWRNFAFMVLPAEIIRMVAASTCTVPGQMFGYRLFNGFFTIVPNFLFDQFYLTPTGRLSQIREAIQWERIFSFQGYIWFILCSPLVCCTSFSPGCGKSAWMSGIVK